MLPNVKLTANNVSPKDSFSGSRAYTFIDSYIYMRNSRFNALYEKNKDILSIENTAVREKSVEYLYDAFCEQVRILDSVVSRIRNFTFIIRQDVLSNIRQILPSQEKISEFEDALMKAVDIPVFKFVRYNIKSTTYPSMAIFFPMFLQELNSLLEKNPKTASRVELLEHSRATDYLKDIVNINENSDDGLLEMEELKIMTSSRLVNILNFFKRKSTVVATVSKDFKTYQFYLRNYRSLNDIKDKLKPTKIGNKDLYNVNGHAITFNDYFVTYKHFSSMMKYMLNIVSYYDSQFFNKIYALQSNIESYVSIMNYVIDYAKSNGNIAKESLTEAWYDGFINSDVINAHNLINGNSQAQMLLWDSIEEGDCDILDKENIIKDKDLIDGETIDPIEYEPDDEDEDEDGGDIYDN